MALRVFTNKLGSLRGVRKISNPSSGKTLGSYLLLDVLTDHTIIL